MLYDLNIYIVGKLILAAFLGGPWVWSASLATNPPACALTC